MKSESKRRRKRMKKFILFVLLSSGIGIAVWAINRKDPDFEHYALTEEFAGKTLTYYTESDKTHLPVLFMLHGAPGSAGNFKSYFKDSALSHQFQIVIPDRLGYGGSDRGNYTGIAGQASFYNQWLDSHFSGRDIYVYGHSYGATIALRMGVHPSKHIKKMMVLAPAIDPKHEKYFPFGKLTIYRWSRWLFSSDMKISGQEKYQHAAELNELEKEWSEFKVPCLYVHGNSDKIVPYINMAYAQKHLPTGYLSTLTLNKKGHLTVFTEKDETIAMIEAYFLRNEIPAIQ
jgi:pimeloyl-ACP methyl ester carboxylesterase